MRIGIEAQRIARRKKHGMDIFAIELIRNLMKIDSENSYFIFYAPDNHLPQFQEKENFKFIQTGIRFYPIWEQVFLPSAVKKYKCDLLHCTASTAPLFIKSKLFVTIHDIIFLERSEKSAINNLYQHWGNKYRKALFASLIKKNTSFITVSNSEAELIKKRTGLKVPFIHNSLPEHFTLDNSESEVLSKYKLIEPYIFFIGNTHIKKNSLNVLKAYSQLVERRKNAPALAISNLSYKNLKRLLKLTEDSSLINKIQLLGYIPNQDLREIYSKAVFFLFPSLRESFGIPIIEAMASGTPVITSNIEAAIEVGADACVSICPISPSQICDAMIELLESPILRDKLIKDGKKRAQEFSGEKMAKSYLQAYYSHFESKTAYL